MQLPAAGREYATWTLTDPPTDVNLEVAFDATDDWRPMTRDGDTATALVAGPDATDNPAGTVVLPLGGHRMHVRAVDSPETLIRFAGTIYVT